MKIFIETNSNSHLLLEWVKMRRIGKIVGFLVLFLCLTQVASAGILVRDICISPGGNLVSGQTQVSGSFVIDLVPLGGYTFDEEHTLQLFTDLNSVTWSYVIIQDDIENPAILEVGQNVNINGWVLSYPSNHDISIRVNMNGIAPTVTRSEEKVMVRVAELSRMGTVISGTKVEKKAMVINPRPIDDKTRSPTSQRTNPVITSAPTNVKPTSDESSVESQQDEIIKQLKRQNELLEEQNKKLNEQNNILQNFIDAVNNFLRSVGLIS